MENTLTSKIAKYLADPDYRFKINDYYGLYNFLTDRQYILRKFKASMGYTLNLESPKTFNEKLQWLKLYDHNPQYTIMVDKILAKEYASSIIGKEHIIPTLGVWDNPEDIDFEILPDQFVLKCNHNSGKGMYICKDKSKMDKEVVIRELKLGLKENHYLHAREWPYKDVKRKILAEKYMSDGQHDSIYDYKFFCFNGVVKCFKIDFDRFTNHMANYYDPTGKIMRFGEQTCPPDFDRAIEMPENLKQMIILAENLSKDIPFLRTDFYDCEGRVYFGELTFYPASGFGRIIPDEFDELLGKWISLPGGGINLLSK